MPLILTDDYIRKNCMSAYPVPLKALKGLKPNGDKTPNYISKRGRSGIRPADMPIYAPASVGSLVKSISNISKLEPAVVETYLENMINNMSPMEELEQILMEQGEMDFLRTREGDEETKADDQSSISFFSEEEREFIESDPELRKIFEVEPRATAEASSQTRASAMEEISEKEGEEMERLKMKRYKGGELIQSTPRMTEYIGELKADPRRFRSGSGIAAPGVGSGIEF